MYGYWFIAGNLVRDLAALNKVELLPWDDWGAMVGPDEPIRLHAELERVDFVPLHDVSAFGLERARELGINISAAAREGVAAAVRAALARSDREAYLRRPERSDAFWAEAEAWSEE